MQVCIIETIRRQFMSDTYEQNMVSYEGGNVMYSPDVVATIAGIAALKVDGIAGMSGGITDGIVQILGFKNFKKGVKAELEDSDVRINLAVVVKYDMDIQKVCEKVQADVKDAVETMTGLNVSAVNVSVQGIGFEEEEKAK